MVNLIENIQIAAMINSNKKKNFLTCSSQMDPEHDRMVSDHVLRMHQYRAPGEQDGEGTVIMTCCGIGRFL